MCGPVVFGLVGGYDGRRAVAENLDSSADIERIVCGRHGPFKTGYDTSLTVRRGVEVHGVVS